MKNLHLLNRKEMKMVLGGTVGPGPGNPVDTTCSTSCNCPTGWILKTGVVFKLTGDARFNQTIFSPYFKIRYPIGKLSLTLTNRVDINTSHLGIGTMPNWRYLPAINLYLPTEKMGSFSFMANKQIILPNSDDLSLNSRQLTSGIVSTGNLAIVPQRNLLFHFSHNYSKSNYEIITVISNNRIKNLISFSPYVLSENNLIRRNRMNIISENDFFLNPEVSMTLNKKLSFVLGVTLGYYDSEIATDSSLEIYTPLINNGFYFNTKIESSLKVAKGLNTSLSLNYNNINYTSSETKTQLAPSISFRISKSMLKNAITTSVAITDILNNSNGNRSNYLSPTLNGRAYQNQPFRAVGFSVSYLFNSKAIKYQPPNNKGIKATESKQVGL